MRHLRCHLVRTPPSAGDQPAGGVRRRERGCRKLPAEQAIIGDDCRRSSPPVQRVAVKLDVDGDDIEILTRSGSTWRSVPQRHCPGMSADRTADRGCGVGRTVPGDLPAVGARGGVSLSTCPQYSCGCW